MSERPAPRALASLPAVVGDLYARVEARDVAGVDGLCEREARRLPREVREEAMAVARTPAGGHRAPLRLLLFWRSARAMEADARDAALARGQLELDLRERIPTGPRLVGPRRASLAGALRVAPVREP